MSQSAPSLIKGRYRLIRTIGSGGFGNTWYAMDELLKKPVAIKVFIDSSATNRGRYLREARNLAKFWEDPGIVSVLDYFEDGGAFYLVMEYLDGEDLSKYLHREGALTLDAMLALLEPVMVTLTHLHEAGVIHRDVSPDNLIILSNGQMKLIDFGSALSTNSAKPGTTIVVKPGYAPPEQYGDPQDQGPWTDVYALAATMWRCLTNQVPMDSLKRSMRDELPKPSSLGVAISPAAEALLMRALALNPRERVQSVAELHAGLTGPVANVPVTPQPSVGAVARDTRENTLESTANVPVAQTERLDANDDKTTILDPESEPVATESVATVPVEPAATAAPTGPATPTTAESAVPRPPVAESTTAGTDQGTAEKPKRGKGFIIGVAAAVVVVLAIVAVVFTLGGAGANPYRTGSSSTSYVDNTTVTSEMLDTIANDSNTTHLNIARCRLDDSAIARIATMSNVEDLELNECTGYTTLKPLASNSSLKELTIKAYDGFAGDTMMPVDFPSIVTLAFNTVHFTGTSEFLGHFPALANLSLLEQEGVNDVEFLSSCPNVTTLELENVDLSGSKSQPLSACTKLQIATLNSCKLDNLKWADGCSTLRSLTASQNAITSVDGLQNKESLTELDLQGNKISDLSALTGAKRLHTLDVAQNQIDDVAAAVIGSCTKLSTLGIAGNNLTSLDFCEKLIDLTRLDASSNHLANINKLASCSSMTTLSLHNNELTNIDALANDFDKLAGLNISSNKISSLKPLEKNKALKNLSANENQLESLDGLQNKPLESVLLFNNRIADITGIRSSAGSIKNLDLGSNEVSSVGALDDFGASNGSSNSLLLLERNKITDAGLLPRTLKFRTVSLYENPLTSVSFLASDQLQWSSVYVSHSASFDYAALAKQDLDATLNLVGVPYDEQAKILRKDDSAVSWKEPKFVTLEEADTAIQELRDKLNEQVNGLTDRAAAEA